jgi:hypothetical protein
MAHQFRNGQRVSWNTSQGRTYGRVKRRLTSDTEIGDWTARASKDAPQYLVVSEATGAEAAHHPDALSPADD